MCLCWIARSHPHVKTQCFAQQNGRRCDTAAGTLNQHCISGLCIGPVRQHPIRGQVGGWQTSGLFKGDARWFGQQVLCWYTNNFGEGSRVQLAEK